MKTATSNTSHSTRLSDGVSAARGCALGLLLCLFSLGLSAAESERVKLVRTPDGGIQPQAALDSHGVVHLIYFKGEGGGGDIFYVREEPGQETFSTPIQVNTQPRSAMAAGTIRGAQLAVGKNGRVHVAWNGHAPSGHAASGHATSGHSADGHSAGGHSAGGHVPDAHSRSDHSAGGHTSEKPAWMKAPMLYTRLNDKGTAFEPERDVITVARGLDGGGSVAADNQGNVYVFWHAPKPGNTNGEAGRALFVARSADDGKTFAPEKLAMDKPTGACGCCGMKAFADTQGNVFALYRAASEKVNRDEILLVSRDHGVDFEIALAHPWKVASCPMSSAFFSEAKASVLAAWETEGKVYFARVNPKTLKVSEPVSPPGSTKRKHPVAVGNTQGGVLLAWTEGTGWNKGGAVAWQLYDPAGNPTSEKGRADGVPTWSLATAFAKPDGNFVIVY
jgi:hypothetical protein